MTDISVKTEEYFTKSNPLTRKIAKEVYNIQHSLGKEWKKLDVEKQEALLNKHFCDSNLSCKYADHGKERPPTYPVYKVESGEKIVVDFVDGCSTWRDEHSGPFSWRTRSQQDLSILDNEDQDDKKARSKFSHSPDTNNLVANGIRSERPAWERAFLTAEQEKTETEEEIFRKFGIAFSSSHSDHEDIPVPTSTGTEREEDEDSPTHGYKNYAYADTSFEGIDDKPDDNDPESPGHVSAVFINDQGETTTDHKPDIITNQPQANKDLPSPLDEWELSTNDNENNTDTSVMQSSGFDFLDNW